jgi:hypothetical protein
MYQHASAAPDIFFQSVSCLISSSVAIPRSEASCSCEAFKFAQCAIAVFRTLAAVHNFMRFGAKKFAALHLTDSIDTSTPMGRFFFHVMGALAEMERELIVERTRRFGCSSRRRKDRREATKTDKAAMGTGGKTVAAGEKRQRVAIILDVGMSTLYKKFPSARRNMKGLKASLKQTVERVFHLVYRIICTRL